MFDPRDKQLSDLQTAYADFMNTMQELPAEKFRITLAGCSALREGAEPFYFYDGTNDYRKVNAKFFTQFPSTDRNELMDDIAGVYDILMR